ncbi:hypothetical protein N3K66_000628 [Trichothecium roseum]|uniref:Uncharacterized protein n=1 Tax=Trichothecium roseum TaxID=47278 RepID=A0ACC0VCS5_9HYPO|nr:hypothetical protein N3K66_000628 [Trichothecium roseum]
MVEQELGHNLIRTLISTQHTTIADQAKHIEGLRSGEDVDEGDTAGVDLMAEIETALEPLLGNCLDSLRQNPKSTLPPQATVFLTGATGYLGSELLRHLLRDAKFGRVVAHARAPSPEAGLERVVKAARINGWWRDSYADRIEIWTGDLGSHRLGLDDGQWDRLAGNYSGLNVDAIVHNGAVVNWNSSYDALYEANVKSATELLRLTMLSPRNPKFIFISGGVKFDTQEDKPGTASALANLMGYTQTKFVAETVINEVALRLPEGQNRISTIKPGRIIGTAEEGVANLDDFLWRIVGTAVAMGAYPTGPDEKWMFIEGVDIISSLVTSKLGTSSDGVTAFDDMKIGVSVGRFWSLVNSQLPPGQPLKPTPLDEWVKRAVHIASEVVGEKHPLYPVQNFLGAVGYPIEPEEGEKAWGGEMVRKLEGGIRASVKYIVECGYVDLCRGEDVELKGVIQRSTAVQV